MVENILETQPFWETALHFWYEILTTGHTNANVAARREARNPLHIDPSNFVARATLGLGKGGIPRIWHQCGKGRWRLNTSIRSIFRATSCEVYSSYDIAGLGELW
jgi:hypothetical protein